MLELLSPVKTAQSPYRKRLDEKGIKGGWNYALDHAWLFENIDQYIKSNPEIPFPTVVDVGCGNGMLHPFLEEELHIGIIGVDRVFGHCPYEVRTKSMDLCIDFLDDNTYFKNNVDIIYWCSAIEHNEIQKQKLCVQKSLDALKPGGLFLATFAFSKETHWFEPSQQTNLSARDAEEIYNCKWSTEPDFDKMVAEFRLNHFDLDTRHSKRYGTDDYAFVVAAAKIQKPK